MNPDQVYPPREDTCLLARAAISEAGESDFVLEVGTGSGYIARSLQESGIRVLATDINPHAVKAARLDGLDVVRADLFMGIRGPFDLVVFNPPYLPTGPEERIDDWLEYALDGGPDGRLVIRRFAEEVPCHLSPGGRVLILVSSVTGCEEVMSLFRKQGFQVDVSQKERVYDEDLVVLKCSLKTGG
jgi:release factor glutamine methyltransferase